MDAGYVDLPCIAGIVIEGPKTIKLNCGGPAWNDYQADPGAPKIGLGRGACCYLGGLACLIDLVGLISSRKRLCHSHSPLCTMIISFVQRGRRSR